MAQQFESVFDAIADSPEEALNMKLRAGLIREIRNKVKSAGWNQSEAASQLDISQPRVSDLLNGKLSKFSLDALVNMLAGLGGDIELKLEWVVKGKQIPALPVNEDPISTFRGRGKRGGTRRLLAERKRDFVKE